MRGEYGGRVLKAVDQQPANIICRVIDRAHDLAASARAQPIRCRSEQDSCRFDIINAFKQTEATDVCLV